LEGRRACSKTLLTLDHAIKGAIIAANEGCWISLEGSRAKHRAGLTLRQLSANSLGNLQVLEESEYFHLD